MKIFEPQKSKKLILSFLPRNSGLNWCCIIKTGILVKEFHFSFRISKQNWNILFISTVTVILKNDIFLLILTFLLTYDDIIIYSLYVWFFISLNWVLPVCQISCSYDFSVKIYRGWLNTPPFPGYLRPKKGLKGLK